MLFLAWPHLRWRSILRWFCCLICMIAQCAQEQSGDIMDASPACRFLKPLSGHHCFGLQQSEAHTAMYCESLCCEQESCEMWLFSLEHGCWLGNHTEHKCVISALSWEGGAGKDLSHDSASGLSSALAAWRLKRKRATDTADSQVHKNCCPGRWCCENATACCPPRRIPSFRSEQFFAYRWPLELAEHHLLREELLSGAYQVCTELTLQMPDLDSVALPAGTEPLAAAENHCSTRSSSEGRFPDIVGCTQTYVDSMIRASTSASVTSAKKFAIRNPDVDTGSNCKIWRWDGKAGTYTPEPTSATSWSDSFASAAGRNADPEACSNTPLPDRAFRWLKKPDYVEGSHGKTSLVPRHSHGQVLVSDAFRVIFVHVPKAGSTTVRKILWQYEGRDLLQWDRLPRYKRETYFTFAVVRDPVSRFVSAYDEVCLKVGPKCSFYDTESDEGLRRFLKHTLRFPCWDEHVCDQTTFLRDRTGQPLRLDMLAETSKLNQALLTLSSILALNPPITTGILHAANPSSSRRKRAILDDADFVRSVCTLHAQDYKLLDLPLPAACQQPPQAGYSSAGTHDSNGDGGAASPGEESALFPDDWLSDDGVVVPPWRGNVHPDRIRAFLRARLVPVFTSAGLSSIARKAKTASDRTLERHCACRRGNHGADRGTCAERCFGLKQDSILEQRSRWTRGTAHEMLRVAREGDTDPEPASNATGLQMMLTAILARHREEFGVGGPDGESYHGQSKLDDDNTHDGTDEPDSIGGRLASWRKRVGKGGSRRGDTADSVSRLVETGRAKGIWWRAIVADWMWRPQRRLVDAGLRVLAGDGVPPVAGPFVSLLIQSCDEGAMPEAFAGNAGAPTEWSEEMCSEREGMEGQGWPRMEKQWVGACFPGELEAVCAMVRAQRRCEACSSVAHYRLEYFMDRAMQARRSGVEGGRLDTVVIVTDDASIAQAVGSEAWQRSYPSWSFSLIDVSSAALDAVNVPDLCEVLWQSAHYADEELPAIAGSADRECLEAVVFISAVDILREASHTVGSVHSALMELVAELSIGVGERRAAAHALQDVWEQTGGPFKLWSVEVPLGAGGGGFYGANVPALVVERPSQNEEVAAVDQADGKGMDVRWDDRRLCDGDWLSSEDDGDCLVDVRTAKEYLPSVDVLDAAKRKAKVLDEPTQDILARLHLLQHDERSCSRARPALFPNHGAAATMNYLVIQLKRGLRDNRPVFFKGTWIYGGCDRHDFSCVFEPESVCNQSHVHKQTGLDHTIGYAEELVDPNHGAYPHRIEEVDPWYVPPIYRIEGKGVLWYNSIVTGFLFNPVPSLRAEVDATLEALSLHGKPFIGVQVRRGDACGQTRPCLDMDLYVEAAMEMVKKYGIETVYLASDDEEAVREFRDQVEGQGVTVAAQALDRGFTAANTEKCATLANAGVRTLNFDPRAGCEWIEDKLKRASMHDKAAQATGVLVDIEMLARADAFVGTFTSALSRVAFQLSMARKGYVKPFRSLDLAWCWAGFHQIPSPWGTYGC